MLESQHSQGNHHTFINAKS